MARKIRCGDHVFHRPSEETWVVAFADYQTGRIAWCGWPEGTAALADCDIVLAADEAAYALWAKRVADAGGFRAHAVRRLYPEALGE